MKIVVLSNDLVRAKHIAEALYAGISLTDAVKIIDVNDWAIPTGDVCLHYGLKDPLIEIRRQYASVGTPTVLFDLGYYGRLLGPTRWDGYHRFAVNGMHGPLMLDAPPLDRILPFIGGVCAARENSGRHILLVGMSRKACIVYGIEYNSWERKIVELIRQVSDRPILYYPKFSDKKPDKIPGTELFRGFDHDELERCDEFKHAWCIVAHHSNLCARAQVFGIPIYCEDGIAKGLSINHIQNIEECLPHSVEKRCDFLARLGYQQWNVAEMASGAFWKHFTTHYLSKGN